MQKLIINIIFLLLFSCNKREYATYELRLVRVDSLRSVHWGKDYYYHYAFFRINDGVSLKEVRLPGKTIGSGSGLSVGDSIYIKYSRDRVLFIKRKVKDNRRFIWKNYKRIKNPNYNPH